MSIGMWAMDVKHIVSNKWPYCIQNLMYDFQSVHLLWLKTYIFLKIILMDIVRLIVITTA